MLKYLFMLMTAHFIAHKQTYVGHCTQHKVWMTGLQIKFCLVYL